MKVDLVLGLQWGDEGKGKIVDVLTPDYDLIARFQGGPNAGHSLEFNGIKHVLHSIPSGIFHPGQVNLIGNGVVIDPVIFKKEAEAIHNLGVDVKKHLMISRKAHLILPSHRILDAASEASKGITKIGSTLKGIGPTYMDKTGRNGIRVGDILEPDFMDKYKYLKQKHKDLLRLYNYSYDISAEEEQWFAGIEEMRGYTILDSEYILNRLLQEGKKVLAEGAQGTMLDIDFGSYPYVTSSNTISAGACTGLGISPSRVGEVLGVFKAYCTRVGGGPFPSELLNDMGTLLREKGHEYGATTGRPRRCGWLDLVALKYSIMINGVTQLLMTKADVLSNFDTIEVCTGYRSKGQIIRDLPYNLSVIDDPVYEKFPGWKTDITPITAEEMMPAALSDYIRFIEQETGVPITMVSSGPDRSQIILRNSPRS